MITKQILLLIVTAALLSLLMGCSTGQNLGTNPQNPRLLMQSFNIGGEAREVQVAGPQTATFPAQTYFVFGSDVSLGNRSTVPLEVYRLEEQSFGPFGNGDEPQDLDLSPWAGYEYIYLRAIVVEPNVIWQIAPGQRYEFMGN